MRIHATHISNIYYGNNTIKTTNDTYMAYKRTSDEEYIHVHTYGMRLYEYDRTLTLPPQKVHRKYTIDAYE